jgi:integrase
MNEPEFQRLLVAAERHWSDALVAMLLLMYDSGLRISEAAAVRWCDLHPNLYAVDVIKGKGSKRRRTWLSVQARWWLAEKPPALRRSKLRIWVLTIRTLQRQVLAACKRAGVRYCHPHGMRHSFATNATWADVHPMALKNAMGHTKLSVTEIYSHPIRGPMQRTSEQLEQALGRATSKARPSRYAHTN